MSRSSLDVSKVDAMSADEAAALWMLNRDRGLDLEADRRFAAWLANSSRNAAAWGRAQEAWNGFDDADDPFLDAMRRDALQARRAARPGLAWIAAAACLAIAVLGAGMVALKPWRPARVDEQTIEPSAPPDFATATGAQATYALPDGSQVTLDTGSALVVRYSADRRAVRLLHGQAYFKVVHDPARPFVTEAGGRTVTDLGTEFGVRLDGAALSVVLAGGSVSVGQPAADATAVVLKPGQRLDAAPNSAVRVSTVDMEQALAWRAGYAEFHDETLSAALAEMARYGGPPMIIVDSRIGDLRVSGRFRTGDTARFVATLSEIYLLRTRPRSDGGLDILAR
jgi:transmembrane sensor